MPRRPSRSWRRTSATASSRRGSTRPFVSQRPRSRGCRCSSTTRTGRRRTPTAGWLRRSWRMASGKRASMREGPLAQLFRKTEEDDARPKDKPRQEEPPQEERAPEQEPKLGRPLPEGGPAPQVTKHVPEPQAHTERQPEERTDLSGRMTEAAKRAEERDARRAEREGRYGRHEGIPTPEERLEAVFSHDIPENIMEREPVPAQRGAL